MAGEKPLKAAASRIDTSWASRWKTKRSSASMPTMTASKTSQRERSPVKSRPPSVMSLEGLPRSGGDPRGRSGSAQRAQGAEMTPRPGCGVLPFVGKRLPGFARICSRCRRTRGHRGHGPPVTNRQTLSRRSVLRCSRSFHATSVSPRTKARKSQMVMTRQCRSVVAVTVAVRIRSVIRATSPK